MTWEIATVTTLGARRILARNVDASKLWAYIAAALEEGGAVLVTREPVPDESWAGRTAGLIDVNEKGRRSVRYGKLDGKKMSMKEWDLMCRLNAWRPKHKKEVRRGQTLCRNGDDVCACLVFGWKCRKEAA